MSRNEKIVERTAPSGRIFSLIPCHQLTPDLVGRNYVIYGDALKEDRPETSSSMTITHLQDSETGIWITLLFALLPTNIRSQVLEARRLARLEPQEEAEQNSYPEDSWFQDEDDEADEEEEDDQEFDGTLELEGSETASSASLERTISQSSIVVEPQSDERPSSEPIALVEINGLAFLQSLSRWVIILCAGGHFAAVAWVNGKVVAHRAFHHYVTRAKQGERQINKDHHGSLHTSVGANMRRQNEMKHRADVVNLLGGSLWTQLIHKADVVFVQAPSLNQEIVFYEASPLQAHIPTIHQSIPFDTGRPTIKNAEQAFRRLSTMVVSRPGLPVNNDI